MEPTEFMIKNMLRVLEKNVMLLSKLSRKICILSYNYSDLLVKNCLKNFGGADRDRTDDLLNAIQALSQLSYSPTCVLTYACFADL
jgi:hypothetical protein